MTSSDQAEAWEAENWRCVYFPRENNGRGQGERAGLGEPGSRLSAAALSIVTRGNYVTSHRTNGAVERGAFDAS